MSNEVSDNGETAGSQECPYEGHLTLDKTRLRSARHGRGGALPMTDYQAADHGFVNNGKWVKC